MDQATMTSDGWRVEIDGSTALLFTRLSDARDFLDLMDSGLVPATALRHVLRRIRRERIGDRRRAKQQQR
jgi:hypothetical protein